MEATEKDEERSIIRRFSGWRMEFIKTFVQTGDLLYKELGDRRDSTTAKFFKCGASAFAGLASLPTPRAASIPIEELDRTRQEINRLALEHAINPNGRSRDFLINYRKCLIKSALQISHSYEMQLGCVHRRLHQHSCPTDLIKRKSKVTWNIVRGKKIMKEYSSQKSQLQGIQKLAVYAASSCVSHLIEKQKIDNPHRSVTKCGLARAIKSWYENLTVDGIRVKWPFENEVNLTAAKFFEMPVVAFYRKSIGDDDDDSVEILKMNEKNKTKINKSRHQLRRPFDFESEFYSHENKNELFMQITVWIPGPNKMEVGDGIEFISKDSSEDIDFIYDELINDPSYDKKELFLKHLISISKTTDKTAQEVDKVVVAVGDIAKTTRTTEMHVKQVKEMVQGALPPEKQSIQNGPFWFQVQDPTESFHGRIFFLKQLHDFIQKEGVTILSQLKIIGGLGGVGKTETARKYIQMYKNEYENIIWLNAETKTLLKNSFKNLARDLSVNFKNEGNSKRKDIDEVVKECYQIICQRVSLIIFDNAQCHIDSNCKTDDGIEPFLPKGLPPNMKIPFFLITSRNLDWVSLTKQVLPLDMFDDNEIIQFVTQELTSIGLIVNSQDALKLGCVLGGLPLALTQAVAYIREKFRQKKFLGSSFTISDYLDKFDQAKGKLLGHVPRDLRTKDTVMTTWTVTLNQIKTFEKGMMAIWLSQVLSILSPNGVPIKFLVDLVAKKMDKSQLCKSIDMLSRYSLITFSDDQNALYTHRLLQFIILEQLEEKVRIEILDFLVKSSSNFVPLISKMPYKEGGIVMANLLSVAEKFKLVPAKKDYLTFQRRLGTEYNRLSNFEQAMALLQDVTDNLESAEPNNPVLQLTQSKVAQLPSVEQRNYAETLSTLKNVFELQSPEIEHPKLRWIMRRTASELKNQGLHEEALELHRQIYEKRLKSSQSQTNSLEVLEAMNDMAAVLSSLGKRDESMEMLTRACQRAQTIFNSKGPNTIKSLEMMAKFLALLRKYGESLKSYRELYGEQLDILSSDDPSLVKTINNMARLLFLEGRHDESFYMYKRVYDDMRIQLEVISHSQYSNTNSNLLWAMTHMAIVLYNQDKYQDSWEWCRNIYETRDKFVCENQPEILLAMNKVAVLLQCLGKNEESLQVHTEVYGKSVTNFLPVHPDKFFSRDKIGITTKLEKWVKFKELWEKIYEIRHIMSTENEKLLWKKECVSDVLWNLERFDESIKILEDLVDSETKAWGLNNLGTVSTRATR